MSARRRGGLERATAGNDVRMGAGVIAILLVIIIVVAVGAMALFGVGAGLWTKRTAPAQPGDDPAAAEPDPVDVEMTSTMLPGDQGGFKQDSGPERDASGPR